MFVKIQMLHFDVLPYRILGLNAWRACTYVLWCATGSNKDKCDISVIRGMVRMCLAARPNTHWQTSSKKEPLRSLYRNTCPLWFSAIRSLFLLILSFERNAAMMKDDATFVCLCDTQYILNFVTCHHTVWNINILANIFNNYNYVLFMFILDSGHTIRLSFYVCKQFDISNIFVFVTVNEWNVCKC